MKKLIILFAIVLCVTACKKGQDGASKEVISEEVAQEVTNPETDTQTTNDQNQNVVTTYYLIRHTEKETSDPSNRDPDLTTEGEARAIQWKDYFKNKNIDAVYSTNYIRTMRTAGPTAKANNLEIINYNPSALNDSTFVKETMGKNVVVVGHSNTTPGFANAILNTKEAPEIDESDYGNLYIVTINEEERTFTSEHFD